MNGMKNAIHIGVLGIWAVLGAMLTFKLVFGAFVLISPLGFWLWFAGFAALTTVAVKKFEGPIAALGVHAAAFGILHLIPRIFPLDVLRLGLDFLQSS